MKSRSSIQESRLRQAPKDGAFKSKLNKAYRWLVFQYGARPIRKFGFITMKIAHKFFMSVATGYEKLVRKLHLAYPEFHQEVPQGTPEELQLQYFHQCRFGLESYAVKPKISIIIPVYKVNPALLFETLQSVVSQAYQDWEICLVDDASHDREITEVIESFKQKYPEKIKFKAHDKNQHISVASNSALQLATGEYVAFLDHDDLLLPHALFEVVRAINLHGEPDILYSDERVIGEEGLFLHGPFYKPDWSPMLHLSCNYTTHFSVYRRVLVERIGGLRVGFEGSQDHDLMLRAVENTDKPVVHIPMVLYLWRAIKGSTASGSDEKPYAAINGMKAVQEALERRKRSPLKITWEPETFHYRIQYQCPSPQSEDQPLVSIVIPIRDQVSLLKACIASIRKSTFRSFEVVILDNDSMREETQSYLQELSAQSAQKSGISVRVFRQPGPFNFAKLNNFGVANARGTYVLLLNNDTVVQTPHWLEELLSLAQWPEVGAVGCKLLYDNNTIQHAGIILQDRKIAAHSLRTLPAANHEYISLANTVHEASAVTAACLLVAKAKYLEVGGLDEVFVPNGYGDVDFCLKLRQKGYQNIYTPYAVLTHFESKTRGRRIEIFENQVMVQRWGGMLMNDPYLNPHFELGEHYRVRQEWVTTDCSYDVLKKYWSSEAHRSV